MMKRNIIIFKVFVCTFGLPLYGQQQARTHEKIQPGPAVINPIPLQQQRSYSQSQSQSLSVSILKKQAQVESKPQVQVASKAQQVQSVVAVTSINLSQSESQSSQETRDENSRAWILRVSIKNATQWLQESLKLQQQIYESFGRAHPAGATQSGGDRGPEGVPPHEPQRPSGVIVQRQDIEGSGLSLYFLYVLIRELAQKLKPYVCIEISAQTDLSTLLSYRYELKKLTNEFVQLSMSLSPHKNVPPNQNVADEALNEQLEGHLAYLTHECDRINHETALVIVQHLIDKKTEEFLAQNKVAALVDIDIKNATEQDVVQLLHTIAAREDVVFDNLKKLKKESESLSGRMQSKWYFLKFWELSQQELTKLKAACDNDSKVCSQEFDALLGRELLLEKFVSCRQDDLVVIKRDERNARILQSLLDKEPATEHYQKEITNTFEQAIEFRDVVYSNIPLEDKYIGATEKTLHELKAIASAPSNTAHETFKKIIDIYFERLLQDPCIKRRSIYQPSLDPALDQLLAMYSSNPSDPAFFDKAISFLKLEQQQKTLTRYKQGELHLLSAANNFAHNMAVNYRNDLPSIGIQQMRADGIRSAAHYINIAKCISVLDQQMTDAQIYQDSLLECAMTTFDAQTLSVLFQRYVAMESVKAYAAAHKAQLLAQMLGYEQILAIIHEQDVLYGLQQNLERQASNTNVSFNVNSLLQSQQQATMNTLQPFINKGFNKYAAATAKQFQSNSWHAAIRSYPPSAQVQNDTYPVAHDGSINGEHNSSALCMYFAAHFIGNAQRVSSSSIHITENIVSTRPLQDPTAHYVQRYDVQSSTIADTSQVAFNLKGSEEQHAIYQQSCELLTNIEALRSTASKQEQSHAYIQIAETACLSAICAAESGNVELALKYIDLAQALFDHAEYTLIKAGYIALGAAKGTLKGSASALKAPWDTAQLVYKIGEVLAGAAYYTAQDPQAAAEIAVDGIGSCFNTFFVSGSAERKAFCEKMTILMQGMSDGFENFKSLPLEDQVEFLTEAAAAFYVTPSKALAKVPWLDESIKSLSKAMKVEAAALRSIIQVQVEYRGFRTNTEVIQRIKKAEEQLGRTLSGKELTEAIAKIEQEILHTQAPILTAGIRSINSIEKIEARVQVVAARLVVSGKTIQPHAIKNTQKLLTEHYHKLKKLEQYEHARDLVKLLEQEALTCEELLHLVNRFDHAAELVEIANKIPELAGKQLIWDFLHFLRPDIKLSQGKLVVSGFHVYHEGIMSSELFFAKKTSRFNVHSLVEIYDIGVKHHKFSPHVCFPHSWDYETIIRKTMESMKNGSVNKMSDGKIRIIGFVSEGFEIRTEIDPIACKIKTAFPYIHF